MENRMEAVQGDITKMKVDAIVNAANSSLLGGGGVDGAIHEPPGRGWLTPRFTLGGWRPARRRVRRGYHLRRNTSSMPSAGSAGAAARMKRTNPRDCYRNSLRIAVERGLKTVAFPAISTGVYTSQPNAPAGSLWRPCANSSPGIRPSRRSPSSALTP